MSTKAIRRILSAAVCFGLAMHCKAAGQIVRGSIVDARGNTGLAAAHVILQTDSGHALTSALTNEQGDFALRVAQPGRYRIRVEMIGRRAGESDLFTIGAGDTTLAPIALPFEPIALEGIDVTAYGRCTVRPGSGVPVQTVWEEARKALSIEAAVREQKLYRYDISHFIRELDADRRRVVNESRKTVSGYSGDPFVSAPARQLISEGFALRSGDDFIYYGPDARLLLSDAFLDTHCFHLQEESKQHPGLIGLAFEPIAGRTMTDIAGVLWLNRRTSELATLEFSYRHEPADVPPGERGGTARFQRLPNGAFIIREWSIGSPLIVNAAERVQGRRLDARRVAGYVLEGAEVLSIRDRSGVLVDASPANVEPTPDRPLPLAPVPVLSVTKARADARTGAYPRSPVGVRESIRRTDTASTAESGSPGPTAVLHGRLVDADDGKPISGAVVTRVGVNRQVATDAAGEFHLTGLPAGLVTLRFDMIGFDSRTARFELEPGVVADVRVTMATKAIQLEPIEVTVRSPRLLEAGFYDRAADGFNGYRFTREEIERLAPHEMTDLIERIPGALVRNVEAGRRVIHFRRWPGTSQSLLDPRSKNTEYGCIPDIYLDGVLVQDTGGGREDIYVARLRDYNVVSPGAIEAVEVYIGANTPIQYRNACGVVLVWTRR